jgi:hypothetical protein
VRKIRLNVTVRSAHSDEINAKIIKHSISKLEIKHKNDSYDINLNKFILRAPLIHYRPADRIVLEASTNSLIECELIRDKVPSSAQNKFTINFEANDVEIKGPVICLTPWGPAFSNQILHILMGIAHCDDMLGNELPILVPDDLTEREISNLSFGGVDPSRFIPIPRKSACRVIDAFIPSKSFVRDSRFGPKMDHVNYGFIFEPTDLLAYRDRIHSHPAVLKAPDQTMPRVIYFSRKDAGGRYTTNEDEAVRALSQFGAHYIMPTKVPIEEIARLVANTDIVISAFGSAILHFLAARPGTTLIEFDHPANDQCGRAICRVNGGRHVRCTSIGDRTRNFTDTSDNPVNISELVELVQAELDRRDTKKA